MTKYVSFSCFGDKEIYLCGAIANAELASRIYPLWTPVFYLDDLAREAVGPDLHALGCKVFSRNVQDHGGGMFWRFEACSIPDAEAVIVRDCDSRLSVRESQAVAQWTKSGKSLHVIRDHPWHRNRVMGGMWGLQGRGSLNQLSAELSKVDRSPHYGADQQFMSNVVYRKFRRDKYVNDSFRLLASKRTSLGPREAGEFIGERVNCDSSVSLETRASLLRHEQSLFLKIILAFASRLSGAWTRLKLG